jgi:hypothetical protein
MPFLSALFIQKFMAKNKIKLILPPSSFARVGTELWFSVFQTERRSKENMFLQVPEIGPTVMQKLNTFPEVEYQRCFNTSRTPGLTEHKQWDY